jgi:hypothetical protein
VDWRDTTEVLRQQSYAPDTPIFVKSGFIEARSPKWLNDEVRLGFLLAPIRMYPIPGTIVALPHEPGPSSDGYMANEVRGLSSREEFFVVDRDKDAWPQWFRFRFGQTFTDEEIPIPSGRGALVIRFRHRVRN